MVFAAFCFENISPTIQQLGQSHGDAWEEKGNNETPSEVPDAPSDDNRHHFL